jgi:hypothetical protein
MSFWLHRRIETFIFSVCRLLKQTNADLHGLIFLGSNAASECSSALTFPPMFAIKWGRFWPLSNRLLLILIDEGNCDYTDEFASMV